MAMTLVQIPETGSRLVCSFSALGSIGPKHHAIIIGLNPHDSHVYIAESLDTGYQLTTKEDFIKRYLSQSKFSLKENDGSYSNVEVAKRAMKEIMCGGIAQYDLLTNNCESFANRAMYNTSVSTQVLITMALLIGGVYFLPRLTR